MYRLNAKAAPYSFKPYDRKRVRRDLHDAHTVSVKLSAALRRERRATVDDVERQIREVCG